MFWRFKLVSSQKRKFSPWVDILATTTNISLLEKPNSINCHFKFGQRRQWLGKTIFKSLTVTI
jgi:hypothetical protein